jgi:RimJ/RimL family protein N-acetyltransferase
MRRRDVVLETKAVENSMNFWQGQKVRLRGVEPSDADAFARWNLDSGMARDVDFVWPPVSRAQVSKEVGELSLKKLEDDGFAFIIEDSSGAAVGLIRTFQCDHRAGTFRYGIHVVAEHRRLGYAGEAVLLVLKYYFHELRYQKCTVGVHAGNDASIALHERLGFQREGTLRRTGFSAGRHFDIHMYGITREEWQQSPHRL